MHARTHCHCDGEAPACARRAVPMRSSSAACHAFPLTVGRRRLIRRLTLLASRKLRCSVHRALRIPPELSRPRRTGASSSCTSTSSTHTRESESLCVHRSASAATSTCTKQRVRGSMPLMLSSVCTPLTIGWISGGMKSSLAIDTPCRERHSHTATASSAETRGRSRLSPRMMRCLSRRALRCATRPRTTDGPIACSLATRRKVGTFPVSHRWPRPHRMSTSSSPMPKKMKKR
mmetsp:Transcript_28790/g.71780  ORF Transcript_28790/g.71780 Transcript_28790/m.71780 type:complete len:233 (-) Transcript_28790:705-1403(-)